MGVDGDWDGDSTNLFELINGDRAVVKADLSRAFSRAVRSYRQVGRCSLRASQQEAARLTNSIG